MTDFTTHTSRMLAAYKKLHEDPGWREYVEARVMDMAAKHPKLYAGIAAQILPSTKPISNNRRR